MYYSVAFFATSWLGESISLGVLRRATSYLFPPSLVMVMIGREYYERIARVEMHVYFLDEDKM